MSGKSPKLVRYVENGNWPISNNLCENAIRPLIVGRKGWLFADTAAGAQASANRLLKYSRRGAAVAFQSAAAPIRVMSF